MQKNNQCIAKKEAGIIIPASFFVSRLNDLLLKHQPE